MKTLDKRLFLISSIADLKAEQSSLKIELQESINDMEQGNDNTQLAEHIKGIQEDLQEVEKQLQTAEELLTNNQ